MGARRRRQKGQAIVLIALMMAVLLGFAGLAIDSARAFDGRRLLQDSVDAAALAAAESYQNGASWTAAQNAAILLFQKDNRLSTGAPACAPSSFGTPAPGSPGTAVVTTCTMSGGTGYVLTLSASDNGPGGQLFSLSATRPLTVALMQVLGQSPTITLTAVGSATANDQALTPALAGLSNAGCFGTGGATPFSIPATTNYLTVVGDVVSNGAASLGAGSFLRLGGDMLTRCAPPTNAANITYECWPGTTPPACTGGSVQGQLRSTANNFADPGYAAPSLAGLVTQPNPLTNVVLSPGIYNNDPQFGFGGPACYFLPGGVYQWLAGMTVSAGIISNELKPPGEPGSNPPFWRLSAGFTCEGSWVGAAKQAADNFGVGTYGNWPVVVTSVYHRPGSVDRESAPSACALVNVAGPDGALAINVSNVPGATSYNVYAARPPATCASQLGMVGSITNGVLEKTTKLDTASCPDPSGTKACSLGAVGLVSATPVYFDLGSISAGWAPNPAALPDTSGAYPPDPEGADFLGGTSFPPANHTRAAYPSGDRANENFCATAVAGIACPAAVTPGAVAMYVANGSCFNVTAGGDAFLFSGYQYNWLVSYEPPATTCANTWQGMFNSAPIGMSYTPGASFKLAGANASQSRSFGGIVAASILVQSAGGLQLDFNNGYAPRPPGTRLTG
jgi:Flp pilus assembly protein TadG